MVALTPLVALLKATVVFEWRVGSHRRIVVRYTERLNTLYLCVIFAPNAYSQICVGRQPHVGFTFKGAKITQ